MATNGCNAHSTQTAFYVEPGSAPHTFDSSSERYAVTADGLRKQGTILQAGGMRGSRGRHVADVREGPYTVSGSVTMEPTPAGLDLWLPRILGAAEASDVFAVAETLPSFGVLADRDSETFQYTDCVVSRATLRGQSGFLTLTLDIVGKTEVTGTSVPAVSLGTTAAHAPYQFADLAVNMAGGTRHVTDFTLTVDNSISSLFFHSLTAECLNPGERIITLSANAKLNDTEVAALYGQDAEGAAATLTLTNADMSTAIALTRFSPPDQSPTFSGKGEFYLPLVGEVRGHGTTEAIIVTHDSNPAA